MHQDTTSSMYTKEKKTTRQGIVSQLTSSYLSIFFPSSWSTKLGQLAQHAKCTDRYMLQMKLYTQWCYSYLHLTSSPVLTSKISLQTTKIERTSQ